MKRTKMKMMRINQSPVICDRGWK